MCIAETTKTHTAVSPAPFSLASSTARRSAVRCRAVSCPACGAVLCRAAPCFAECSLSCIPDDNAIIASIQSWPEPACRSSTILCSCGLYFPLLSFIFHCFLDCNRHPRALLMQQQTAVPQYVRVCMSLNREHSKAQRNPPCTRQQTKYVPIRVRIKSMYVHACCVPFVFLEHGSLGIGKSPVCT